VLPLEDTAVQATNREQVLGVLGEANVGDVRRVATILLWSGVLGNRVSEESDVAAIVTSGHISILGIVVSADIGGVDIGSVHSLAEDTANWPTEDVGPFAPFNIGNDVAVDTLGSVSVPVQNFVVTTVSRKVLGVCGEGPDWLL